MLNGGACLLPHSAAGCKGPEQATGMHSKPLPPMRYAGNWPAIIFGVVSTSLGLLGVMAAGCYSDLKALVHGDKGRKRKGAASSQRSTKAAAAGNGHVAS